MLKLGIIEVGESDYMSPMILVEVAGKEPRPCIDYRKLNGIIRTEYFPLPNIEERVEKVSAAKFITVFDLSKGYWQIPLSKNSTAIRSLLYKLWYIPTPKDEFRIKECSIFL
ncbi:retrovirus-related Pol polyprotein from transposon 17.6 [Trichonephila clavipes]|uniref:Retrovirus-related Pol polyprotein from transposon 17.6 n=1 Tax=Trichonephila clavipes TaxID=2585209 RepID=A0A8X6RKK6_TRICX|nr:retrovirus-related Pol polyprotein from transposon 17.6 [Trichonephila clavipes]